MSVSGGLLGTIEEGKLYGTTRELANMTLEKISNSLFLKCHGEILYI